MKLPLTRIRQIGQSSDGLEADIFLEQLWRFFLQEFFEQMHQSKDLGLGALPILGGECVESEVFDLQIATALDTFAHSFGAFLMTFDAREAARLCPSAIAIHDDGDMARN